FRRRTGPGKNCAIGRRDFAEKCEHRSGPTDRQPRTVFRRAPSALTIAYETRAPHALPVAPCSMRLLLWFFANFPARMGEVPAIRTGQNSRAPKEFPWAGFREAGTLSARVLQCCGRTSNC